MTESPATFITPAGWAERCTMRDDGAEHQIRITSPGGTHLFVSCTCMGFPDHITTIQTCEEAWAAYRDYHEGKS